MKWEFLNDRPIYSQIVEQLRLFIASGKLNPGDRLPSVRELAQDAGVNPNTMQRALAEMERMELLYSNRTSGRYVTENVEIINSVKRALAEENISTFLNNMQNIGFNKNEIIELIDDYKKGMK